MKYPETATDKEIGRHLPGRKFADGALVVIGERIYKREGGVWWLLAN